MSESLPARTRWFLGALYVSQYLGLGFLMHGAAAILRVRGISLESLAAVSALGLVWALKFLWAPLIDRVSLGRRGGHYRPWVIAMQVAMAASLVAIALLDDLVAQLSLFIALAGVYVFCSATQDIAVDALAVRITPRDQRATVNGIQVAGSFIGNIVGGGLMALLYELVGWTPAVLCLALLTLVPTLAVLRYTEPVLPQGSASTRPATLRSLVSVVRQPGAPLWMFVSIPLLWGGLTAGYSLMTPALVDAGWSVGATGSLLSMYGSAIGAVTGLVSGAVVLRLGRVRALLVSGVVTAVGLTAFAPIMGGWAPAAYAVPAVTVFFITYAVGSTLVYTINMDYSRHESPGSDYTAMSSFAMFVSFLVGAVALQLAGRLGYLPVLVVSVVVFVIGIALTVYHQRRYETHLFNLADRRQDGDRELVAHR